MQWETRVPSSHGSRLCDQHDSCDCVALAFANVINASFKFTSAFEMRHLLMVLTARSSRSTPDPMSAKFAAT